MKQRKNFSIAIAGGAMIAVAMTPTGVAVAKPHKHARPHTVGLSGVVIHENDSAHSFIVAERSGKLDAIHGKRAPVGARVSVRAIKLANGTLAERKIKVIARATARRVQIEGVVSVDDRAHHELVVSASGTSIAVKADSTTAGDAAPQVGETVHAEVQLSTDGNVEAVDVRDLGRSGAFKIEGKVLALDVQARTLSISADDNNVTGASVKVMLPASFDLTAFRSGECLELTVTKNADGSFTAVQSFGDDNAGEADNGSGHGRGRGGPGDDRSDHHHGGENDAHHSDSSPSGSEAPGSTSESHNTGHGADGSGSTGTGTHDSQPSASTGRDSGTSDSGGSGRR